MLREGLGRKGVMRGDCVKRKIQRLLYSKDLGEPLRAPKLAAAATSKLHKRRGGGGPGGWRREQGSSLVRRPHSECQGLKGNWLQEKSQGDEMPQRAGPQEVAEGT